ADVDVAIEALLAERDRLATTLQAEVEALRAEVNGTIRELLAERDQLAAENARLREEIGRLLDSREREGDRLDWLLARLPGDVIRDLVGEMSCTSDACEWRDRIDKAARFKIPNPDQSAPWRRKTSNG